MDRNFDRGTGVISRGMARGESLGEGFLDDYSLTGLALLRLHAATGDPRWLKDAGAVGAGLIRGFWDPERRVFFQTRKRRSDAPGPVRLAAMDDGVLPGGGSAAIRFPALEGKVARKGEATAYVCELGSCQSPTSDPSML